MIDYGIELQPYEEEISSSRRVSHVASSLLLGNHWLFTTGLLLVISLIARQVPLLLISLLFFLTGAVSRLWERYCLTRVEYKRHLSTNRVFFGDELQLEIEIANKKALPLPWIRIEDQIPADVELLKGSTTTTHDDSRLNLVNLLSLNWYHRVRRRYRMRCLTRGCFAFGPARIRSGDLFGVFNREMEIKRVDYLMVYPRMLPLEKLGIPSKQPMGDIRTRRHIFPDPTLTQGVREYQPGDSLKQIHWKASARMGELQTKVLETTTTVDMGLFLDVRTLKTSFLGTVPELLELGIVATASIARHSMDEGYRVGLFVNNRVRFPDGPIRILPSQHQDQLLHMLEALAQVKAYETMPIGRLIVSESRNLPWGSSIVVISAAPTDELISTLISMKRAGRRVVLILVGGEKPSITDYGLTVYHVPGDVMWRDLESISL